MAAIEQTVFEFPDELEAKKGVGAPETEAEIEIVDDTPEEDRGRTKPSTPPAEVTDAELERYSDQKLKARLAHLGKGYHDERRAKEAALREREEAVRAAQLVVEENKRLQGSLASNQTALLEQAKKVVATEVDEAKRAYREAYEAGDADGVVNAQARLTAASIQADKVQNFKPAPLQPQTPVVQTQQAPQVDAKTQAWLDTNQWFGVNRKMTAYARSLHQELVDSGVSPSSDRYFSEIDSDMKQRFPEAFAGEPAEAQNSQRSKSNVAPATRSTAPKKIVLTQTQVNLAKRLGVPLELYARKVAEELRK